MKQTIEIPEGYEFDHVASPILGNGGGALTVLLKKKQTKTFDFYIDEYLRSDCNTTNDMLCNFLEYQNIDNLKQNLKASKFEFVPWEVKIGLFKFICIQIKQDWFDCYHSFAYETIDHLLVSDIVLPQPFIDNLFKTK